MTQDLTPVFLAALDRRDNWHLKDVAAALREQSADLQLDWDEQAGEEWMRVLDDAGVVGLIWSIGPATFVLQPRCSRRAIETLQRLGAVVTAVQDFDAPEFEINLGDIKVVWPMWRWSDAIPTLGFSINDLWWATV